MAADQHRKRLSTSNFIGCTSREQHRTKKKKVGSALDGLNVRSNICLTWDYQSSSVVAKKEQISISRRDFIGLSDVVPNCNGNLLDVFTVPQELFELENLVDILSYEVWCTHLSDNQRNILMEFLPVGSEPDNIVRELLSGDNFHFGNPFLKWGGAVCSGKLHPDYVNHQEHQIKACKIAYYSELHKYHKDMIDNLQMWKIKWGRCQESQDLDEDVLDNSWRSRKQPGKRMPLSVTLSYDREECIKTLDSSSLRINGEPCTSNVNLSLPLVAVKPVRRKSSSVRKIDSSPDRLEAVIKLSEAETLDKQNIQHSGGAQYMSYIKVSKEQHQRVKNTIKHASNNLQPRSLNSVLGNLDTLHVQPFEIFEEEERQKLRDYWLKLANRDVPAGLMNWTNRKLEASKLVKALGQEIEGRTKFSDKDEGLDSSSDISPEQVVDRKEDIAPSPLVEDEEKKDSIVLHEDEILGQFTNHEIVIELEDESKRQTDNVLQGQVLDVIGMVEEDNGSVSVTTEDEHPKQLSLISSNGLVRGMNMYTDQESVNAKSNDYSPFAADYPGNANHGDVPVHQEDICLSADSVWSTVGLPGSYYPSNHAPHEYVSPIELSLSQTRVEEQPTRGISMEMDTSGEASRKDLLLGQSEDPPLYTCYPNQARNELQEKDISGDTLFRQPEDVSLSSGFPAHDRNELFEPFFRSQGGLPYHNEQKRIGFNFQQSDNIMVETDQFSGFLRDQVHHSQSLDARERRVNELYVDHTIRETVYSEEGRYSYAKNMPVNMQGWGTSSSSGILASPLSLLNGGDFMCQNWILGENQCRGVWSGTDGGVGPSRGVRTESNSDQSLFSVVSECKELRSGGSRDSIGGSSDRLMQSGAYNSLGQGITATDSTWQQNANSLNYSSDHENAGAGYKVNNLGWTGVLHQNPGVQESMSKLFLKSWNQ